VKVGELANGGFHHREVGGACAAEAQMAEEPMDHLRLSLYRPTQVAKP
jgi:hypothetical protein